MERALDFCAGVCPKKLAASLEALPHTLVDLSMLWPELISGSTLIKGSFSTEFRCYLVLGPPAGDAAGFPLDERSIEVLRRVMLGEQQKAIAVDLSLSQATVNVIATKAMHQIGFDDYSVGAWASLTAALQALREEPGTRQARMTRIVDREAGLCVLDIPRPDSILEKLLSPKESVVTRLMLEGKTYAEMAHLLNRSVRTIANQLSASYEKLGTSGRAAILCRLLARPAHGQPALQVRATTRTHELAHAG